jgi:hypothetical protein
VSAGAAARVRGLIEIFWVAAVTLGAVQIIRRRGFRPPPWLERHHRT